MKTKTIAIAIFMIALAIGGGAALLAQYGKITGNTQADAALKIDGVQGSAAQDITETINLAGGESIVKSHSIENLANVPKTINIVTETGGIDGLTVTAIPDTMTVVGKGSTTFTVTYALDELSEGGTGTATTSIVPAP